MHFRAIMTQINRLLEIGAIPPHRFPEVLCDPNSEKGLVKGELPDLATFANSEDFSDLHAMG
jgi:hypothetical protein